MLPFLSYSTVPALCGTWTPSSTNYIYVRPLSHLSVLAFVGFVDFAFLTLRCYLFFIFRCHIFLFINSCTFSYYHSSYLMKPLGETLFCILPYRSFFVLWKCLSYCLLEMSKNRRSTLGCCHFHLSLLRRSSAEPGRLLQLTTSMFVRFLTFTGFCHFRISHTSLLPIFHTSLSHFSFNKLMHFLVLAIILFFFT